MKYQFFFLEDVFFLYSKGFAVRKNLKQKWDIKPIEIEKNIFFYNLSTV